MPVAADFLSFPGQEPPTTYDMARVQQHLSGVTLVDSIPDATCPGTRPWSEDREKFDMFTSLKNVALGNCRLLYGSERSKFYDLVLGVDEDQTTFCVALICSKDNASKILRTCLSDCPVKATQDMVNRLQKDTMPLLMDFGTGSQMIGQQGYTHDIHDNFRLGDGRNIERPDGPVDDTETITDRGTDSYAPRGAPRGPRADRPGCKRARRETDHYRLGSRKDGGQSQDARMANAEPGEIIEDDFYD